MIPFVPKVSSEGNVDQGKFAVRTHMALDF